MKKFIAITISISILILSPQIVTAATAIFEKNSNGDLLKAQELAKPEEAKSIYGQIKEPGEVDFYTFTVKKDVTLPIVLWLPKRDKKIFKPNLALIGPNFIKNKTPLFFSIPEGDYPIILEPNKDWEKTLFYDKATLTQYYRAIETEIDFTANKTYFLAVFEQKNQIGDYVIKIGFDFPSEASDVFKQWLALVRIKFGRGGYFKIGIILLALLFILAALLRIILTAKKRKAEAEDMDDEY